MQKFAAVVLLAISILGSKARSHTSELCSGIFRKNNMRITANQLIPTGITREQYDGVLDKIETLYKEEVAAEKGEILAVIRNWGDESVNAYAARSTIRRILIFPGGLARHPQVTRDAFALVACHEMGHHRGGAPLRTTKAWASIEGQADYYANLKCMRRFLADEDNTIVLKDENLDILTKSECESEFTDTNEQLICMRSVVAGKALSRMFRDLSSEDKTADVATPDPLVVLKTSSAHPDTQCRLDTYFNAARCAVPVSEAVSNTSYQDGTCDKTKELNTGSRPRCWFLP
ncbi:MAG TPA: hypothetical protein VM432_03275 [Bdellovibrionales bacterium]|nr:hypothetical protein [Bdellovibrionales bacterium]